MPADLLDEEQLWIKLYRTPKTIEREEATGHINQAGVKPESSPLKVSALSLTTAAVVY